MFLRNVGKHLPVYINNSQDSNLRSYRHETLNSHKLNLDYGCRVEWDKRALAASG
jgi:hypothetical protein